MTYTYQYDLANQGARADRMSKTCGGLIAGLIGLGKGGGDRAVAVYCNQFPNSETCEGGRGDFLDFVAGLNANQQGIGLESNVAGPEGGSVGAACRHSSEDCCNRKAGYNNGQP